MDANVSPRFRILAATSLSLVLSACGGGGGGGGGGSDTSAPPPAPSQPALQTGIIVDSPIANLPYRTSSGVDGVTNGDGAFQFASGDTITFSLGNLDLPEIAIAAALTPLDIFSAKDIQDRRVVNFIRLIQSLDNDGDISERILLHNDAATAIDAGELSLEDFDQDPLSFATSNKITAVLSAMALGELVSQDSAVAHFSNTLATSSQIDTDRDSIANRDDPDDDNDGVPDLNDALPYDERVGGDFDLDGVDNITDSDDDNDGVEDIQDDFPYDASETKDSDEDGIGNNADPDDDNDGIADVDDTAPLDPQVSGDFDGDGVDNIYDSDDDNDGVVDSQDHFPRDSGESRDFDGDGVGDNADTDDDNDNLLDSEDRANIVGNKSVYMQEEPIQLRVEGFDPNFQKALDQDGWHVQFYTYDLTKPDRYMSEYVAAGVYNARFDTTQGIWLLDYWAPKVPGNYRTDVILYCSASPSFCDSSFPYEQVEQSIYFESTCAEPPCSYELDNPRGSYVTNSYENSYYPALEQRSNGELVAIYSEGDDSFLTRSVDAGSNWQVFATLPEKMYSTVALIENSQGKLLMLGLCSNFEYCVYETADGSGWLKTDLTGATNFAGCDQVACNVNYLRPESMIEADDGRYLISYALSEPSAEGSVSDIYVTSSGDLQSWTAPIKVSTGEDTETASQLLQTADGTYYLTYVSLTSDQLVVAESPDMLAWSEKYFLPRYGRWSPRLLEIAGVTYLFFHDWESLHYSALQNGSFSAAQLFAEDIPAPATMLPLQNGRLGLIYEMQLNNQGDIFYEALDAPSLP